MIRFETKILKDFMHDTYVYQELKNIIYLNHSNIIIYLFKYYLFHKHKNVLYKFQYLNLALVYISCVF
jgi:hypothetical protein